MTIRWTDNVSGSDSNDGLTESTPKQNLHAHTLADGDVLNIKGTGTPYNRNGSTYTLDAVSLAGITIQRWAGYQKPVITHTGGGGFGRALGVGSGGSATVTVSGIVFDSTDEGGLGSSGSSTANVVVQDCEFYDCGLANDVLVTGSSIVIGTGTPIASLRVLRCIVQNSGRANIFGNVTGTYEVGYCQIEEPGEANPAGNTGDCVECGVAPTLYWVHDNTFLHTKNSKQCVQQSGATTGAAVIEDNVFLGAVGDGDSHKVIYTEQPTTVQRNWITTGGMAINLKAACYVHSNVIVEDGPGWAGSNQGPITIENVVGGSSFVRNNTIILESGGTNDHCAIAAFSGDTVTIQNNIISGAWDAGIRRHSSATTESYNDIFGVTDEVTNESLTPIATGTGTITSDPAFGTDYVPGAAVRASGASVTSYLDVYGMPFRTVPSMGARQFGYVDTAAERFSAIHILSPWRGVNAFADGTIARSDRAALGGLYSGTAFTTNYEIVANAGTFNWTGYDATLTPTTRINTADERFSAIHIGLPWRGINVFPGATAGQKRWGEANLYVGHVTTAISYTLVAESGTFVWDGEPSFSDFEISGIAGSFAMTGNAATFIATRTLYATAGVFTMTGNDANLNQYATPTLVAVTGAFTMTGQDAVFDRPRTLVAETGNFDLVGWPAIFTWFDENGVPTVIVTEQPTGGFAGYGYSRPRKKKKEEKPKPITTAKEIVKILETPRKPVKSAKETDAERRKKEEELLLLG